MRKVILPPACTTFGRYTGGIPGPTDYISLVAQLKLADQRWFDELADAPGTVWIAPEAARGWLDGPFQRLMYNNKNQRIDAAAMGSCKRYQTTRPGNKPVTGFVCKGADTVLLYIVLSDRSARKKD